jgi:hypothetical protein
MASEPHAIPSPEAPAGPESLEMPRPTVAPIVLSLGLVLMAAGVPLGLGFLVVGAVVFVVGLALWVANLLPGRGHVHERLAEPGLRPRPVTVVPGTVERLQAGMPGYRMRLPETVHPVSAGIKGGIAGGVVMALPALLYGLVSGHGLWYPVNLLAAMVLPGITQADAEHFHFSWLLTGVVIHAAMSVVVGLLYGVLLPTLPDLPRPMAWGGLLMPLLWTAATFLLLGVVNPVLAQGVDWPWFIFSQFVFGVVAAAVFTRAEGRGPLRAGLLGGLVGGLLMPVPAVLWSLANGRGLWYPVNLLAGLVVPGIGQADAEQFHPSWLLVGLVLHAILSLGFGLLYGWLLPRLPTIPGPTAWGGLLMPLLWTAVSYGLMGVVNPLLQRRVDWPWFIVSQFVFGLVASQVVVRSEKVHIPPAGQGPDRVADFVLGPGGGRP